MLTAVSDAIHSRLADIQASLTASCTAESTDGAVRAEANARRQLALELTPAALKMRPDALAALILTTQQEAQAKAETTIAEKLDTFRADPRVAGALDTLRDTQANPPPPPKPRPQDDEDDDFVSVYGNDRDW